MKEKTSFHVSIQFLGPFSPKQSCMPEEFSELGSSVHNPPSSMLGFYV